MAYILLYTYNTIIIPIVRSQTAITTIRYETRRIRFLLSPIGDFRDENNFLSTAVCSGYYYCSIKEKFRNEHDHAYIHIAREKITETNRPIKIIILYGRCVIVGWTKYITKTLGKII